jgi:hypothetical protein
MGMGGGPESILVGATRGPGMAGAMIESWTRGGWLVGGETKASSKRVRTGVTFITMPTRIYDADGLRSSGSID